MGNYHERVHQPSGRIRAKLRSAAFTPQKRPLATIVIDIRKISARQSFCGLKSALPRKGFVRMRYGRLPGPIGIRQIRGSCHPWRVSKIIGIDLGTTNSLVATVDSGIPYVVADGEGRRLTPSVVHYPVGVGNPIVGIAAERMRITAPERTFFSVKRFIGRRFGEVVEQEKQMPFSVIGGDDGGIVFTLADRESSPENVSAEILKQLKEVAETDAGEVISRAVITVPAYFNDAQRNATRRAGELAGLTVERIINEPTAAALAYGLDRLKERSKIAVYDLGGGTFDLSILELNEGVFRVLATNGNTALGGDDIDGRLMEFLFAQTGEALGSAEVRNPAIIARIRAAAVDAKIRLSSELEYTVAIPFLKPNYSFECKLNRDQLDELSRPVLMRTREHCIRSLADAGIAAHELDQVILVGGQTRMPLVRRLVGEWFGCADFDESRGSLRIGTEFHETDGPVLNTSQNPDEAVALGAAIQGEILSGGFRNVLLLDITPLSLGIETFGGLMNVIIPRNSTIPLKAGEVFTTAVDHQREMLIHVLQGERDRAKDNWSLGRFPIGFEKASRGVPRVGVQFEIDADGILHVLARDIKTGHETIVEMKSAVDVDDSDVQKMVEESVEHAFDDLRARRWIEASLKAVETLDAARVGLESCRDELEPGYRESVAAAVRDVEGILASEGSIGSPEALKSAHERLDEITQPLAELLMEKAMDEMLARRGVIG